MNFEIKRLADVKMILRVFTIWIFVQVLRDIVTYSVLMFSSPSTIIWQVAESGTLRIWIAGMFAMCAVLLLPHFVHTLLGIQGESSKRFGRVAVFSLFFLFLVWITTLIPYVLTVSAANWYTVFIYSGNAAECLALATVFAWNINQYMKYELDYGLIQKVPADDFQVPA
jgi:hypothetical protein